MLIPSPIYSRLLKGHPIGLGVVPERAVYVLVAVAPLQQDFQRIARLDAVAVRCRLASQPRPARLALTRRSQSFVSCMRDPVGVAVHVAANTQRLFVAEHVPSFQVLSSCGTSAAR